MRIIRYTLMSILYICSCVYGVGLVLVLTVACLSNQASNQHRQVYKLYVLFSFLLLLVY